MQGPKKKKKKKKRVSGGLLLDLVLEARSLPLGGGGGEGVQVTIRLV